MAAADMSRCKKRLEKEFKDISTNPQFPTELVRPGDVTGPWRVWITGAPDSVFAGEKYLLEFTFGPNYPLESPICVFVAPYIPTHEHIYSNGHICLSILYDQQGPNSWSPALRIDSVAQTIVSMLSSATEKAKPSDDARYMRTARKNPKETRWDFHDEKA